MEDTNRPRRFSDVSARSAWILSCLWFLGIFIEDRMGWPETWLLVGLFLAAAMCTTGAVIAGLFAAGGKRWRRLGAILVGLVVSLIAAKTFNDDPKPEKQTEEPIEVLLKRKIERVQAHLPVEYPDDVRLIDVSGELRADGMRTLYKHSVPETFDPKTFQEKWLDNMRYWACRDQKENPGLWKCGYKDSSVFVAADNVAQLFIETYPADSGTPDSEDGGAETAQAPYVVIEIRPEDCARSRDRDHES